MSEDREMPLTEHLDELRRRGFRVLVALGIAVAVYIAPFSLFTPSGGGEGFAALFSNLIRDPAAALSSGLSPGSGRFEYESLTTLFINYGRSYVLPPEARLIVGSVGSVFTTILQLALVLAVVTILPYIVYEALAFAWPGLYEHEKRVVIKYTLLSTLYVALGISAGFFITAYTVIRAGLYWGTAAGAEPVLTLQGFVNDLVNSIIGTVAIFVAPPILLMLTELRIVDPDSEIFRNKKLIYALAWVVIAFFFPDLTTVILLLMFVAVYEPTFRYMKRMKKKRLSNPPNP